MSFAGKERAMGSEQFTLYIKLSQQLEDMQQHLAQQKRKEELLVRKERKTQRELEELTV